MLRHLTNKSSSKRVTKEKEIKEDFYRDRLSSLLASLNLVLDTKKSMIYEVPACPSLNDVNKHLYSRQECTEYLVKSLANEGFFVRQNKFKVFICWIPSLYPVLEEQLPCGPKPNLTSWEEEDEEEEEKEKDEEEKEENGPINEAENSSIFVELIGSDFQNRARLSEYLSRKS